MRAFFAALALAAAPLIAGEAMAAPVAAAPAKPLDRLVDLLTPEDALLNLAGRAFDAGIRNEIAADPELMAVQRRHPGLAPYVAAELRPAFLKLVRKEIPSLRRDVRAVVADGLTAPEIAEALTFFSSPTGIKLREQAYATMAEKPDQSPEAMQAAVLSAVMKNMRVADYPALLAFGASSVAAKMNTLNPRIVVASKAWSDGLVARHSKRMRGLAAAAAKRYLRSRK